MNKNQIICNSVFAVAIIALFVLYFFPYQKKLAEPEVKPVSAEERVPVAYINLDSLLQNYTFAIEANEKLMSKQEDARLKLNTRARSLQSEMVDFQRKIDNNAFLSRERAENEQNRLLKKQQELQDLEAKLTQDIVAENQALNMQLADTLDAFLKEFNADGRYHIIFTNTQRDNLLQAKPAYDISSEVIEALNSRYNKK